jgi:HEAT repeat protein/energy-coupling factor transporter ATP-binding protein EcfA2
MTDIEQIYRQHVVKIYNRIPLTGLPERAQGLSYIPVDKIFIKLAMAVQSVFKPTSRFEPLESKTDALTLKDAKADMESKASALEEEYEKRRDVESKASALEEEYEKRRQWEREQLVERSPKPIALASALQKYPRLLITGAPGSGKTTLLRWLAVIFATQQQAEPDRLGAYFSEAAIPIVIELRRFYPRFKELIDDPATFDLAEVITSYVGKDKLFEGVSEQWMSETLAHKPCLLLIDGLDEIASQNVRQRFLEALAAFVQNQTFAKVRCLLTTRPHGFRDVSLSAQFQRTEIQAFTVDEVAEFIQHWYETAYEFDYQDEAQALISAIQDNQRVTEIAQNPLLCTIIAIIYRNNRVLPNRRVELYFKCCEALLDTWERNKLIKESGLIGGFDWQTKLELLMPVAYWFHEHSEQLAMPEEAVVKQLAHALGMLRKKSGLASSNKPIEQEARDFIKAIRDRSGLLQGRGDDTLEFTHRTFQEYLAARHIAALPEPIYIDTVMVHLHQAWWREVHLLVIGHLGSSGGGDAERAERLLLTILNVYKAPSRWLLPPTNPWLNWLKLGKWFPRFQWQKQLAWHLMREFELAAQGYADCAISAKTQILTTTFSELAERRVSKWFNNSFYDAQLSFLLTILKQQALPREAVIAIFRKALQDQDENVRGVATFSLRQLGETNPKEIDALLLALQNENEDFWVRRAAAFSLRELGETSPKVIDALLLALQDNKSWVQRAAAESLGQLGETSPKVIDALLLALQDEDKYMRRATTLSLGQLGETSPKVIDALLLALRDQEKSVRSAAAKSLGQLGETSPKVIYALLLALQDKEDWVQRAAAESLGQLGETSPKVIDALLLALQDEDKYMRRAAALSLGQLDETSPKVIDALLLALQDKDVRRAAAGSLGQLGETSPKVIDALLLALHDEDKYMRHAAAGSLGRLGETSPKVIDALLLALQDEDKYMRHATALSLGQLGETSPKVIDALLLALQDEYEYVRGAAAESLGQLKIEAEAQLQPVLIALNRRLHDNNEMVRRQAYESLRKLLDGLPIPGYRWKPLAKQQKTQKLRLLSLVFVLIGLIGLLFAFQLPVIAGIVGFIFTVVVGGTQLWLWLKEWWKSYT